MSKATTKEITVQAFLTTLDLVDAVHTQLENLTPPEALEVLKMVAANLKAEIADFYLLGTK